MVADLPSNLQQKVIELLKEGKFADAKEIHDRWVLEHPDSPASPAN